MKLKRLRERNNLTQQELAELIHTSKTNISHWETGEYIPQMRSIALLRAFFGINIEKEDFREAFNAKQLLKQSKNIKNN